MSDRRRHLRGRRRAARRRAQRARARGLRRSARRRRAPRRVRAFARRPARRARARHRAARRRRARRLPGAARRAASTRPVLFLTARDALPDRLSGFHAGGDDYLTKPFALAELLVRVARAAAPRARRAAAERDRPALVLDPAAHAIVHDGDARVPLTPTEFRLLAALAARPGEVVRRAALVAAGWPDGAIVHDNTLDAYIARIRRKLRDAGAPRGDRDRARRRLPPAMSFRTPAAARRRSRRWPSGSARCSSPATSCSRSACSAEASSLLRGARRGADRGARRRRRPASACARPPTTRVLDRQRVGARRRPRASSARRRVAPALDRAAVALGRARRAARGRRARRRPPARAAGRAPGGRRRSARSSSRYSIESLERLQQEVLIGSLVLAALVLLAGGLAIRSARRRRAAAGRAR